jgi:hypothetical protein
MFPNRNVILSTYVANVFESFFGISLTSNAVNNLSSIADSSSSAFVLPFAVTAVVAVVAVEVTAAAIAAVAAGAVVVVVVVEFF